MRQKLVLFIIIMSTLAIPVVIAQNDITPISLTLTIYSDGTTIVDYSASSNPAKVRVTTELFGSNITSLIVRDEEGNPLQVYLLNETIQIDSIGAIELHFTYQTDTLTHEDDFIWVANVTSPVNVTFILPKNANFFDSSEVPQGIGQIGDSPYLSFGPGVQYVYYILGLPSVIQEANSSIAKASNFVYAKADEGYILPGAVELLIQANAFFDSGEYLEAKNSADEALIIASDIIEFADDADFAIHSAESSINEAIAQGRTIGLDAAEATLSEAVGLYDGGLYRNAEIVALQAAEEATDAEKPEQNNQIYLGASIAVITIVLWLGRKRLGSLF